MTDGQGVAGGSSIARPRTAGEFDHDRVVAAVREILIGIGEDPERDGLRDTPERVSRAYAEMFRGLRDMPESVLSTVFDIGHDELVLVKDIEGSQPRRRPGPRQRASATRAGRAPAGGRLEEVGGRGVARESEDCGIRVG